MINYHLSQLKFSVYKKLGFGWEGKLNKFDKEVRRNEARLTEKPLRILMGPSFAIYAPSFTLDRVFSYALRLRGAEIIPIYCDSIQKGECNYIGGEWGGNEFEKNCSNCKKTSENLWKLNPHKPLAFSQYITPEDIARISAMVEGIEGSKVIDFVFDGMPYGRYAKDVMVNNYLVASPDLVPDNAKLIKVYLHNFLLVACAYERILDEQKPDRVVSNDSYYGMWAILEQLCKRRSIPFYCHWPVTGRRIAIAYNDSAMNLDLTKSWQQFSQQPLTLEDEIKIDNWLGGDRGLIIDTTKLSGNENDEPLLNVIDRNKPTVILVSNLIWDMAALNKQVIFKDMPEWITATIEWFGNHTDYQLIVRPHPAEIAPQIPNTKETVGFIIEQAGITVPSNVFVLKPDAKITLNELSAVFKVRGLLVHTTSAGFESPAKGSIPVITTAKSPYRGFGFTLDPVSKNDYFDCIISLMENERGCVTSEEKALARKFIKFYQYHYFSDLGIFVENPQKSIGFGDVPELREDLIEVLQDGNNVMGYIMDCILKGEAINDVDKWLPKT